MPHGGMSLDDVIPDDVSDGGGGGQSGVSRDCDDEAGPLDSAVLPFLCVCAHGDDDDVHCGHPHSHNERSHHARLSHEPVIAASAWDL